MVSGHVREGFGSEVLDGVLGEGISGALWGPGQAERGCGVRSEVGAMSEDNPFSNFYCKEEETRIERIILERI